MNQETIEKLANERGWTVQGPWVHNGQDYEMREHYAIDGELTPLGAWAVVTGMGWAIGGGSHHSWLVLHGSKGAVECDDPIRAVELAVEAHYE